MRYAPLPVETRRKIGELFGRTHPQTLATLRELAKMPTPDPIDNVPHNTLLDEVQRQYVVDMEVKIRSNAFRTSNTITDHDGVYFWESVFEKASRFNHSCDANCVYNTSAHEGIFIARANRNIAAGDELTIQYTHQHWDLQTRRALHRNLGFYCRCHLCQAQENATVDDYTQRLQELLDIQRGVARDEQQSSPPAWTEPGYGGRPDGGAFSVSEYIWRLFPSCYGVLREPSPLFV
ncbi:hypothetical protein F5Y15DRAFT_292864 [Xylariaceae sp. FL0016]|nr:hypothetical protein F5Y15DRAFT_292864 [Xylariaceae sp. FL0016]